MTTRFEMENQQIEERKVRALETIAERLAVANERIGSLIEAVLEVADKR